MNLCRACSTGHSTHTQADTHRRALCAWMLITHNARRRHSAQVVIEFLSHLFSLCTKPLPTVPSPLATPNGKSRNRVCGRQGCKHSQCTQISRRENGRESSYIQGKCTYICSMSIHNIHANGKYGSGERARISGGPVSQSALSLIDEQTQAANGNGIRPAASPTPSTER